MTLIEAKRELREHGYLIYNEEYSLNYLLTESNEDMLNKVKGLLTKFKNKIVTAKKNNDTDSLDDAKDDLTKLADEFKEKVKDAKDDSNDKAKLGSDFFRNTKLIKGIMTGIAVLMLSAAGANAANQANMDATLGHSAASAGYTIVQQSDGNTSDAFNTAMNGIDKASNGSNDSDKSHPTYKSVNFNKLKTGHLGQGMIGSFTIAADEDGDGHSDSHMKVSFEINGKTGEATNIQVGGNTYDNSADMKQNMDHDLYKAVKQGMIIDFEANKGQLSWLDAGAKLH